MLYESTSNLKGGWKSSNEVQVCSSHSNPQLRLGLAVITHAPLGSGPAIDRRLTTCLEYVSKSYFPGEVVVVNDGCENIERNKLLEQLKRKHLYPFLQVLGRNGISVTKNIAIRYLLEYRNCDIIMLVEDDVTLLPFFVLPYLNAYEETGIQHFSWSWDQIPWPWDHSSVTYKKETVHVPRSKPIIKLPPDQSPSSSPNQPVPDQSPNQGVPEQPSNQVPFTYPVVRTSHLNGCFMFLTKQLIERIGYFKVLPNPWGHEHTNYTMRAVAAGMCPFFTDVINSNHHILMGPYANASTVTIEDKLKWEIENEVPAFDIDPNNLYVPYHE